MARTSRQIHELRPVTFRFREPEVTESTMQFGLIAEEVAEVMPELVVFDEEGRPETVKYHLLSSLLLNEVQAQRRQLQVLGWLLGSLALAGTAFTVSRSRSG